MAFVDEEVHDEHAEFQKKGSIIQSAAELRDKLFDENQEKAVKVIGGTVIVLYLMYRWLMK